MSLRRLGPRTLRPFARRGTAAILALCPVLAACGGAGDVSTTGAPPSSDATSSFARLQSSVLTPTCAVSGCHVNATAAASGNLVLAPDVAYENLVNAVPTNLAARRDGLKRVVPFKPDSSVLFQKVVLADGFLAPVVEAG